MNSAIICFFTGWKTSKEQDICCCCPDPTRATATQKLALADHNSQRKPRVFTCHSWPRDRWCRAVQVKEMPNHLWLETIEKSDTFVRISQIKRLKRCGSLLAGPSTKRPPATATCVVRQTSGSSRALGLGTSTIKNWPRHSVVSRSPHGHFLLYSAGSSFGQTFPGSATRM